MIKKILKFLLILQEVDNKGRVPKLGRGFHKAYKLNAYNPLSYISLLIIFIIGTVIYGLVGFWEKIEIRNPFKWD